MWIYAINGVKLFACMIARVADCIVFTEND